MEKTTTINIQNEANIKAKGTRTNHCTKPIICVETGEVFTSVTDAAEFAGVSLHNMSMHLTGKARQCKGKHYCYLSRSIESLDVVMHRLRETSAMEDDARKWREYQAEQEAIRKAEEKRIEEERKAKEEYEANVQKAADKIERRHKMCERLKQQLDEAYRRATEAEKEYEALTGETYAENNYGKEEEVA